MVGKSACIGAPLRTRRGANQGRPFIFQGMTFRGAPYIAQGHPLTHLRSRRAIFLSYPIQPTSCEKNPDFGASSEFFSKCS